MPSPSSTSPRRTPTSCWCSTGTPPSASPVRPRSRCSTTSWSAGRRRGRTTASTTSTRPSGTSRRTVCRRSSRWSRKWPRRSPDPVTSTDERRSGAAPTGVRRRRGVQRWHVAAALVGLVVAGSASLFIGVGDLTPADLLDPGAAQARVLWTSRVPRLLAILLAGSAMAVAGLVMMHLTRNRFVSPQTAGTTEWVGLGIVVATLSFGGTSVLGKMTIGVAFALVGTALFVWLLQRMVLTDVVVVPLVGILLGGVVTAATTFLAYRFDLLQSMDVWMNGDFSGVLAGRYELLWLVLGATVLAYLWADRFSVAGMGESFAVNLGVAYTRVVMVGLAIASIVTAIVVVSVGSIPFLRSEERRVGKECR